MYPSVFLILIRLLKVFFEKMILSYGAEEKNSTLLLILQKKISRKIKKKRG